MKRTPLKRKTPLRSKAQLRRAGRIKAVSNRKRKEIRETRGPRSDFKAEYACCPVCRQNPAHECHEIFGGSVRRITCRDRRFWLALCHDCHRVMQGADKRYQLAWKLVTDPEHFDLRRVNEVAGGGERFDEAVIRKLADVIRGRAAR